MNLDPGSDPRSPQLLTQPLAPEQLPAELLQALQALENDQQAFETLASELLAAMRPDIERQITEMVHEGLRKVWKNRAARATPTEP
jgi:hypothetical protein